MTLIEVLESAVDTIRPAAEAKQIRLQVMLDPAAGPVSGDPDRLKRVFWNLLSNAVKFTPRDDRIQIHSQRINSHVEIVISDTGIGIEPQLLPFVFDRFRQGDSGTNRQNTGLGLGPWPVITITVGVTPGRCRKRDKNSLPSMTGISKSRRTNPGGGGATSIQSRACCLFSA
jgi:K+-sensing histidine kinase KdpD